MLTWWLAGCTARNDQEKNSEKYSYTDDLGRKVLLSRKPQKIMALAPSMTEMLFFICDESQIVAVTQNCNYPEKVKSKPVINNYPMDFEALLLAKPDLVFTVEGITPLADAERMQQMGIPVYYQTYATVDDILEGMKDIGKITGHEKRAQRLADSLLSIKKQILQATSSVSMKPEVLAITWTDPIYAYGKNTLLTDKLRIAGASNAIDTLFDAPFPALTREYILQINPDIILGGSFEKMDSTFFTLYPELKKTKAYQTKRVYQVTDDLNSRPSPRVMEAILELKQVIHPDLSTTNL